MTFSRRFNDKMNKDEENTFNYVSQTSTAGEKLLKTRA